MKFENVAFRFHGPSPSAVFFSRGGNDFAGMNDLLPMLKDGCAAVRAIDKLQTDHPHENEDFLRERDK